MKKLFKAILNLLHNRVFISYAGMLVGSIMYCFAVVFILDKGEFYASGITGISQILANKVFKKPVLESILMIAFNVPMFIMGVKNVSKRFAVLSLTSVIVQALAIYLFQLWFNAGFDPFKEFVYEVVDVNGNIYNSGLVTMAIFGGIITGIASGITLRCGASTGGTDIISQAFSFKTGVSFVVISLMIDIFVITLATLVNGSIAIGIYTLIRLCIANLTLNRIYTVYHFQKIVIITKKPEEMKDAIIKKFIHGITMYPCKGAFTGQEEWTLESVVLSYEVEDYRRIIKSVDENAFMYYHAVKGVMGKFIKKAIS